MAPLLDEVRDLTLLALVGIVDPPRKARDVIGAAFAGALVGSQTRTPVEEAVW